jgi:hypothetical protein
MVALHTAFNPAYLFLELQIHHELYSVAAWLGWLVRGRPAYLCRDSSQNTSLMCSSANGQSSTYALLTYYADTAAGAKLLKKSAQHVIHRTTLC